MLKVIFGVVSTTEAAFVVAFAREMPEFKIEACHCTDLALLNTATLISVLV